MVSIDWVRVLVNYILERPEDSQSGGEAQPTNGPGDLEVQQAEGETCPHGERERLWTVR